MLGDRSHTHISQLRLTKGLTNSREEVTWWTNQNFTQHIQILNMTLKHECYAFCGPHHLQLLTINLKNNNNNSNIVSNIGKHFVVIS